MLQMYVFALTLPFTINDDRTLDVALTLLAVVVLCLEIHPLKILLLLMRLWTFCWKFGRGTGG